MKVHALYPFQVACEMDCGKNQNKTEPEVNVKFIVEKDLVAVRNWKTDCLELIVAELSYLK